MGQIVIHDEWIYYNNPEVTKNAIDSDGKYMKYFDICRCLEQT